MRRAPTLVLILVLAALAAPPLRAETVRAIEFHGLHILAEDTVRYYLGLEEGQELDEKALDRNVHELWDRRLVDDIRIEKEPVEGGVKLVITVVERPILRSIDYKGLHRISRTDISERISKDQIDVREGDPLDFGELNRLKTAIESMYKDKGYRFADARFTVEEVSPTERRVLFQIDEAEKVRIGAIRFDGNKVISDRRLRWAMKKTKKTNLFTRILKKDIYNPATVEEDLGKVRDTYRAAGYKNVVVGEPQLSVMGSGGKRRLAIHIPIEEGDRWKLGEISIEGNKVFTDQALLRQFRKPRGGWLRSKAVNDGLDAIKDLYRNHGHIFSEVTSELREREGRVADLIVKVEEGDQYRVGRLEFQGNTSTRDKVLRREFRAQEGTVLNMGAVKSSLYKINQLGYFKLNEDEPISFQNFDSVKKTVDLLVKGEEADRTELQIGGGFSEGYGWFGQLSVKTQNFLGRGETVGVSFQNGAYANQFDVSYFVPWFLDKPQSIGFQVFNNKLDYSYLSGQDEQQKSKGVVFTYGRNLGLFNSLSVSLTRSDLDQTGTFLTAEGTTVTQRYIYSNASVRPAWVYESRDDRFEPTRGGRMSASVEYAGGFLGGQNYFVRPELGASWFLPVTRSPLTTVFAVNAEAGHVGAFGGHPLNRFERYFLGGETSIRGFRYRSLWVRCTGGEPYPGRPEEPCHRNETMIESENPELGIPLGGDSYFQLNLEYHFVLGGPFRILAFFDGANVYGNGQSIDPTRLRWSAGAEMRIFVPMFGAPLRFIYAKNLRPLPGDQFDSFQFSIGATF
jgi:outer membrane protein insertion porin family